jgi:hypothetical protein
LILAVILVWLGIGSIGAKRWARALTLILSWMWMIIGVAVILMMVYFIAGGLDQMIQLQGSQSIDYSVFRLVMIFLTFFLVLFLILLPIGFILFYNSKNVKYTVEQYDPKIRWTDKCPLPVLAASIIFGYTAIMSVFYGVYDWIIPFMGFIFSGWIGALILLMNSLVCAYLAFQFYYLDKKSWLIAIVYNIFWSFSIIITFSRNSIWDLYEKMNIDDSQIAVLKSMTIFDNLIYLMVVVLIVYIGYLLYIKRYFYQDAEKMN